MTNSELVEMAKTAIISYDKENAIGAVNKAIVENMDLMALMNEGFIKGITEVGDLFGIGQVFLPELILAAGAMEAAIAVINDTLPKDVEKTGGIIVIGTVAGDVHDIGKTIVVSLFKANGFEVHDLGRDVSNEALIKKAQEVNANIIGTSALLSTTMNMQKNLEDQLKETGLKGRIKTMVGGAPVTKRWADRIGADAYAEDAADAVRKAQDLIKAS